MNCEMVADRFSFKRETANGVAIGSYSHLTAGERDRIADLLSDGQIVKVMA
jgi:hypothetical protein